MPTPTTHGSNPILPALLVNDSDSSPEMSKPSPPPRLPSRVQAWLKLHERQPPPKRARSFREPLAPSPVSSRLRPRGAVNLNESDLSDPYVFSNFSLSDPDRTVSSLESRLNVNQGSYRKN